MQLKRLQDDLSAIKGISDYLSKFTSCILFVQYLNDLIIFLFEKQMKNNAEIFTIKSLSDRFPIMYTIDI